MPRRKKRKSPLQNDTKNASLSQRQGGISTLWIIERGTFFVFLIIVIYIDIQEFAKRGVDFFLALDKMILVLYHLQVM